MVTVHIPCDDRTTSMLFDGRLLSDGRFIADVETLHVVLSGERFNFFLQERIPFVIELNERGTPTCIEGEKQQPHEELAKTWASLNLSEYRTAEEGSTRDTVSEDIHYTVRGFYVKDAGKPRGFLGGLFGKHHPPGLLVDESVYMYFSIAGLGWLMKGEDVPLLGTLPDGSLAAAVRPLRFDAATMEELLRQCYRH